MRIKALRWDTTEVWLRVQEPPGKAQVNGTAAGISQKLQSHNQIADNMQVAPLITIISSSTTSGAQWTTHKPINNGNRASISPSSRRPISNIIAEGVKRGGWMAPF